MFDTQRLRINVAKKNEEISPANETEDSKQVGKGHATPTRKEREAANKRPLVPSDRKEAAKMDKARIAEERNKARLGLARGEERYLPTRDRGPQKKYVRDYVDARFSLGELMVPLMMVVVIMSLIPNYQIQYLSTYVLWFFVLLIVADAWFVGFQLKRKLTAKFGSLDKGVRWYAAMRCMQMRVLRLPKPQVRRRQYPQ